VKASFTQQELTAWINKEWKYALLTDAQIRINPDNTAEISGVIHTDRIEAYARAMGFTGELEDFLGPYQRFIVGSPTIYMKAKPSVTGNNVVAGIQEVQIGRISVPSSWLESNAGMLESLAEQQIRAIPGASVKSLTFTNGKANFDGSLPAVISRSTE
jgi:hypothetical protein